MAKFDPNMPAEERLKKLIADQLSVEEADVVDEAAFIADLNADSLDLVELIMSLEEEFDTKITDEESAKIITVGDAKQFMRDHGKLD